MLQDPQEAYPKISFYMTTLGEGGGNTHWCLPRHSGPFWIDNRYEIYPKYFELRTFQNIYHILDRKIRIKSFKGKLFRESRHYISLTYVIIRYKPNKTTVLLRKAYTYMHLGPNSIFVYVKNKHILKQFCKISQRSMHC